MMMMERSGAEGNDDDDVCFVALLLVSSLSSVLLFSKFLRGVQKGKEAKRTKQIQAPGSMNDETQQ